MTRPLRTSDLAALHARGATVRGVNLAAFAGDGPAHEPGRWEVSIPIHFASLNVLIKLHHMARARRKAKEARIVGDCCVIAGVPEAAGKRRVGQVMVLVGRDRRRDRDNCFKGLLDGLVKCRRLVDDGPDWVETTEPEYERGKVRETRLIIEDVTTDGGE